MTPADPIRVALMVIDVFDALGVPYAIGGSLASSTHGLARATQDVDLVADLRPEHVAPLLAALAGTFYVDAGAVREAVAHHASFNVIHLEALYKIDVFVVSPAPISRQQLARRRLAPVLADPERRAYVLTPEDIVLQKLAWFRAGGESSERQWRDVLGVLKVQAGRLDVAFLRASATDAGLTELLERALTAAAGPLG